MLEPTLRRPAPDGLESQVRDGASANGSRRAVLLTLVGLLVALGVALLVVVPWDPLPGAVLDLDVQRDFTAAQAAREVAFHDALRPQSYLALVLALAAAAVLGLTPLGAHLVALVGRRFGGRWWAQVLLGTLVVTAVGRLVTLPLQVRAEGVLREYGLSRQTWGSWAADVLRGVLVDAGIAALVLLAVVGLARVAGRTWWAWGAGATAALVVAGSFAYPVAVEPMFSSFTPLAQGELREQVLALAEQDGVDVDQVLVSDASERTSAVNAYVSGFGSSRRVVLYDNLVQTAPPEQVLLVVAHELAHARFDDVRNGTLLGALGAAAAVCALAVVMGSPRVLRRAGVSGPGDARAVPLLLLLVSVGTLVTAPAVNLVSRQVETRADVHSLDLTRDAKTFRAVQQRLAVVNLSDLEPDPVAYAVFSTHPSVAHRFALAREWQRLVSEGRR